MKIVISDFSSHRNDSVDLVSENIDTLGKQNYLLWKETLNIIGNKSFFLFHLKECLK